MPDQLFSDSAFVRFSLYLLSHLDLFNSPWLARARIRIEVDRETGRVEKAGASAILID